MNSTEQLTDRHLECFGRGDLDGHRRRLLVGRERCGDFPYILWRAETINNIYEAVADTFVIQNGKIILHSFGGKIQAKNAAAH